MEVLFWTGDAGAGGGDRSGRGFHRAEELRHDSEWELPEPGTDPDTARAEFYIRIGVLLVVGVSMLALACLLAPGIATLSLLVLGVVAAVSVAVFVFWARHEPERARELAYAIRLRFTRGPHHR